MIWISSCARSDLRKLPLWNDWLLELPILVPSRPLLPSQVPPPTSQHRFVSNLNPLSSPVRRALLKSSVHKGSEHRTAGSVGAGETSNEENDVQMSKLDI